MARLMQGDVGRRKTVVAALAMLMALDSRHQVAFMAPTDLLAEQHARTLRAFWVRLVTEFISSRVRCRRPNNDRFGRVWRMGLFVWR